jgi:hypothetical protein
VELPAAAADNRVTVMAAVMLQRLANLNGILKVVAVAEMPVAAARQEPAAVHLD